MPVVETVRALPGARRFAESVTAGTTVQNTVAIPCQDTFTDTGTKRRASLLQKTVGSGCPLPVRHTPEICPYRVARCTRFLLPQVNECSLSFLFRKKVHTVFEQVACQGVGIIHSRAS